MKKIALLYGLWFFNACNLPSSSSKIPNVTVHTDNRPEPLNISILNSDEKGYLNLSNKIVFHGFFESGRFKNTSFSTEDALSVNTPVKMNISSICTTANKKRFTKDIHLTRYNFDFAVMDLIPQALFFQEHKSLSSCSFFFIVTDTQGEEHRFSLKQQPLTSIPENKNLTLADVSGKDLSLFEDKIIQWEDKDDFFLISRHFHPQQILAVVCDQLNEVIELKDYPATPVFRLLYSTQNPLPSGVQNCRILSRTENMSTGITKIFKIDFSSFNHDLPQLKLSNLSLFLNSLPPEPLFQIGKWHRLMNIKYTIRIVGFRNRDLQPNYNRPHLNSLLELEGLPEDFYSTKYSPIKIQAETKCANEIFPEKAVEQIFHFNLIPFIPLMSVTPLETFQMNHLKKIHLPKTKESDPSITNWSVAYQKYKRAQMQQNKKSVIKCTYIFNLYDLETNGKLSYPPFTYHIHWNSGGIGIAYDHEDLIMGIPIFYEDTLSEGAGNILFPFKTHIHSYPPHIQEHFEPDSIVLKCGSGLRHNPKPLAYHAELPLEYTPFSLPLSKLFLTSSFREYMTEHIAVKCRTLLYQKDRLLYFSPEIQVLTKISAFRRELRSRKIKYDKVLSEQFIWHDIRRFFFTL